MKRRRGVSKGEEALWKRATENVRPIGGQSQGPSRQRPPGVPVGETTREAMTPVSATPPAKAAHAGKPAQKSRASRPSAFTAGDPGAERRVKRGKIEVERALDLHGLREAQARTRLAAFIATAARDGCRCVLVVTGKGRADADPYAQERPRGVIRKRFQEWVDEEPLRSLIARAAPARAKDGGAGAFYVFLKGGASKR